MTVIPRILSELQRVIPGSGGGVDVVTLHFFEVKMISTDFVRLRVRLLALDHASICSNSNVLVWLLLVGIMRYLSSAYLDSKLPGVTACKSAASTTYMAGPMEEPVLY